MSDIKRFTGFIAIDGSTHTTIKAATEHTREVKVQRALAEFAKATRHTHGDAVTEEAGIVAVYVDDLPKFISDNRVAILAALNQDVTTRKPRGPNKAKAAKVEADAEQPALAA